MKKEIEESLERLKPFIQRDGGDIEFVDYDPDTKTVYIQMIGTCKGCPASHITLKNGVEAALREDFPNDVEYVEQVFLD